MSWPGQQELEKNLLPLKSKSQSRISAISKVALKHAKYYKHVVHAVERFIRKAKDHSLLPALYVIDSICRMSRQKNGSKDTYVKRFEKGILRTIERVLHCPSRDKPSVIRVVTLWRQREWFDEQTFTALQDLIDRDTQAERDLAEEDEADEQLKLAQQNAARAAGLLPEPAGATGDPRGGSAPPVQGSHNPAAPPPEPKKTVVGGIDLDDLFAFDYGEQQDEDDRLKSQLAQLEEQKRQVELEEQRRRKEAEEAAARALEEKEKKAAADANAQASTPSPQASSSSSSASSSGAPSTVVPEPYVGQSDMQRRNERAGIPRSSYQSNPPPSRQSHPSTSSHSGGRYSRGPSTHGGRGRNPARCPGYSVPKYQDGAPPGKVRVLSTVLWIGGPPDISDTELLEMFSGYGFVHSAKVVPPSSAFVYFTSRHSAENARQHKRQTPVIGGKPVKVGWGRGVSIDKQNFNWKNGESFVDPSDIDRLRRMGQYVPEEDISIPEYSYFASEEPPTLSQLLKPPPGLEDAPPPSASPSRRGPPSPSRGGSGRYNSHSSSGPSFPRSSSNQSAGHRPPPSHSPRHHQTPPGQPASPSHRPPPRYGNGMGVPSGGTSPRQPANHTQFSPRHGSNPPQRPDPRQPPTANHAQAVGPNGRPSRFSAASSAGSSTAAAPPPSQPYGRPSRFADANARPRSRFEPADAHAGPPPPPPPPHGQGNWGGYGGGPRRGAPGPESDPRKRGIGPRGPPDPNKRVRR